MCTKVCALAGRASRDAMAGPGAAGRASRARPDVFPEREAGCRRFLPDWARELHAGPFVRAGKLVIF